MQSWFKIKIHKILKLNGYVYSKAGLISRVQEMPENPSF